MHTRRYLILVFALLFSKCQPESYIPVLQDLCNLTLARVIAAENAYTAINKVHSPTVKAKKNIIAAYGTKKKDLL
jgi:hypothetical protein